MQLYFENKHGSRRLIGEPKNSDESWKIINDFCDNNNFKINYVRSWLEPDGEKYYDVGSHSEFFIEVGDGDGDT